MKNKLKIGIIGAGLNTKAKHIPGFQSIDGVQVVAVSNRTKESGEKVAKEFNIPKVYESWPDLIDDSEIDAVCIGTWPYMHYPITMAAFNAGKHVLTEARMAMNAAEANAMLEVSRAYPELVAQIVPSPFTFGIDKTIKKLISEGYVGNILSVQLTSHTGGFIDKKSLMQWRLDRDLTGYNVMLMGIWYEALIRWIGPASSVTAVGKVNVNQRKDLEGNTHFIDIPDHLEVICQFPQGAIGHLRFTTVTGHAPGDQIWIYGSEGTIRIDTQGVLSPDDLNLDAVTIFGGTKDDEGLQLIEVSKEDRGYWRVEEEFIAAIRGQEQVLHTTFSDGVKYMEYTEAVHRSIQESKTIYLPL
ncbi:MAG: putative dehydrogenase [Chloroflexi bacterium]|nr:MAG: putative dehydrogenase [Chloroflexota bacterium]